MKNFDLFDRKLTTPEPIVEGEAHVKLKRNLDLALDRHKEIMADELQGVPHQTQRLIADVATATVKAALATDKTALKARQDNALERVFLRVLFHRKRRGDILDHEETERLRTATRIDLEASLDARQLAEYDRMGF